jgi:hypothetical protein
MAFFQGMELPLPFNADAPFYKVLHDIRSRFPGADILFDEIEIEEGEAQCVLGD